MTENGKTTPPSVNDDVLFMASNVPTECGKIVMACIVMAYKVMAYTVMVYIVMAYTVMAYIVLYSYGLYSPI